MKRWISVLTLAGSVATMPAVHAFADELTISIKTTKELRAACNSSEQSPELRDCLDYIKSAADMMRLIGIEATDPKISSERDMGILPFSACNVPSEDKIRVAFLEWSQKNPALLKVDPVVGVWQSVSSGWHCVVKRDFDVLPH